MFRVLCFYGRPQDTVKPFQQVSYKDHQGTAESIEPEIRHPVVVPADNNDDLCEDGAYENRITPYVPEKESQ